MAHTDTPIATFGAVVLDCPDPAAPGWSGIGCREVFMHLSGQVDLEGCKTLWLRNTRAYAKRQLTWFQADPDIEWFAPAEIDAVRRKVARELPL